MHEMSLVRTLLQQVHALCRQHAASRADVIRLRVGTFCGADPQLLRSAYELATERSDAGPPATLEITEVPLEARCDWCGRDFHVERFCFVCPACGGNDTHVVRGDELLLESVTFEKTDVVSPLSANETAPVEGE